MAGRGGYGPPGGGGRGGGPGGPGGGGGGGGRGYGGGGGGGGGAGERFVGYDAGVAELARSLQGLKLSIAPPARPAPGRLPPRAVRPGDGSAGEQIQVMVNHFAMRCTAQEAYHYDVAIDAVAEPGERERPARRGKAAGAGGAGTAAGERAFPQGLARRIMVQLAAENGWPVGWAYDGRKNMYAPSMFLAQGQSHEYSVRLSEGGGGAEGGGGGGGRGGPAGAKARTFRVVVRHVASLDMRELNRYMSGQTTELPRSVLQVLDIVLRHGVALRSDTAIVGASVYFYSPQARGLFSQLGRGAEAWAGYKQAIKVCRSGLALNLDMAATAFLASGPLAQLAADLVGMPGPEGFRQGLRPPQARALREALRGVRVTVEREGQSFRKMVRGLSEQGADRTLFRLEDPNGGQPRNVSVAAYFHERYGHPLRHPYLPCVDVSADRTRRVWLPMEVCKVAPGQRRRVLDDRQTAAMLSFAGLRPPDRRRYLADVINRPEMLCLPRDPTAKAFGIEVEAALQTVGARVLPPPRLAYGSPECVDPGQRGSWNLKDVRFPGGSKVESWAVCCLMPQQDADVPGPSGIREFVRDLTEMLKRTGVDCVSPPTIFLERGYDTRQHVEYAAEQAQTAFGKPAQILLVVLPTRQTQLYREIKQATDSLLGVASQCVVAGKAGVGRGAQVRGRLQYAANVALKINAKMGGINVKLAGETNLVVPVVGSRPFIIFGADVTHPTSFDTSEPSIASVVASYDRTLGRYASRTLAQAHRTEVITGLKEAAKSLLTHFYFANKQKKPEAIVFFRDGVAENQFDEVLKAEYQALRDACTELEEGYFPPITFVVVLKRHGTRLFPVPGDARHTDRSGNVMPGTVVDQIITHPTQFDFFLNSHAGLQGHNKSAHYHVLVDENGFSADGLQLLTYWLCFLYCRCTRTVSIVPAAYYAHLAAFRGRLMVQFGGGAGDAASEVSGSSGGKRPPAQMLSISEELSRRMFYV